MRKLRPKRPRCMLDTEAYRRLHRQVLERDSRRCQVCGARKNLQVHHLEFRSRSGDDSLHNLITLCVDCHRQVHDLT